MINIKKPQLLRWRLFYCVQQGPVLPVGLVLLRLSGGVDLCAYAASSRAVLIIFAERDQYRRCLV